MACSGFNQLKLKSATNIKTMTSQMNGIGGDNGSVELSDCVGIRNINETGDDDDDETHSKLAISNQFKYVFVVTRIDSHLFLLTLLIGQFHIEMVCDFSAAQS